MQLVGPPGPDTADKLTDLLPGLASLWSESLGNSEIIVAAAGNEGCECLHVPAALPSVLAVGAMDSQGKPLESSNWGGPYRQQGILAPGERIAGALPGGGVGYKSGTSSATAIVSGIIA